MKKKAYNNLLEKSTHYTTDEWLKNHEDIEAEEDYPVKWFVTGEAETLTEEVIKFKFNERCNGYKTMVEMFPEDLREDRIDYNDLKNKADDMYYFIERLYSYI